jgi:hypothetical protein
MLVIPSTSTSSPFFNTPLSFSSTSSWLVDASRKLLLLVSRFRHQVSICNVPSLDRPMLIQHPRLMDLETNSSIAPATPIRQTRTVSGSLRRSMRTKNFVSNSSDVEELSSDIQVLGSGPSRIAHAVVIETKMKPSVPTGADSTSRGGASGSTSTLSSAASSVINDIEPIVITPDTSVVNTPAAEQVNPFKRTLGENKKRKRSSGVSPQSAIVIDTSRDASVARQLQDEEDAGPSTRRKSRRADTAKLSFVVDSEDDIFEVCCVLLFPGPSSDVPVLGQSAL